MRVSIFLEEDNLQANLLFIYNPVFRAALKALGLLTRHASLLGDITFRIIALATKAWMGLHILGEKCVTHF